MSAAANSGWATVSELARLRGVDKSAISRRVARLEEQGLLSSRQGGGRAKLVCVEEYDRVVAETGDAVLEANGRSQAKKARKATVARAETHDGSDDAEPILSREQARRTKADADLKEMARDEQLGRLVRADRTETAIVEMLQMRTRVIDQLPGRAEEFFAEATKGGLPGFRAFLRKMARGLRSDIADRAIDLARRDTQESGNDEQPQP
jgi:DNA-binding MarR family transcriptional regulator